MASYTEHINQAKKNLKFLEGANSKIVDCIDWQITTCFYIGVHLINAYLADKANFHFRSHEQVANALNPQNQLSITKVSWDEYLAYRKLQNLSRRSRYLVSDDPQDLAVNAHFVSEKHLCKSLCNLDVIMQKIATDYGEQFLAVKMSCDKLKNYTLNFFHC